MDSDLLLFWQAGPTVKLSPPEIARELLWGEDVEGLVDLPVREILDRLKAVFPKHDETSGLLHCHASAGAIEVTWTWQFIKAEYRDITDDERQRFIEAIEAFGCMAFDPQR